MIKPRYHNAIFFVIDPRPTSEFSGDYLAAVGLEDNVIQHLMLIKDMDQNNYDDIDLDRRMNKNQLCRRYFTTLAV